MPTAMPETTNLAQEICGDLTSKNNNSTKPQVIDPATAIAITQVVIQVIQFILQFLKNRKKTGKLQKFIIKNKLNRYMQVNADPKQYDLYVQHRNDIVDLTLDKINGADDTKLKQLLAELENSNSN